MAGEEVPARYKGVRVYPTEDDPNNWIAHEARVSTIITSSLEQKFTIVEDRLRSQTENWAAYLVEEDLPVHRRFGKYRFAMYEFAFKKLGVRMPFSDFAMGVFDHLHLAPCQLNPNSLGFIRAYELVCEHKGITPTIPMFFRIFQIQRKAAKDGRQCWVSLRSRVRLFENFVDSIRDFKNRFFLVRAESREANDSMYPTVTEEVDGEMVTRKVAKFPLSWSFEHFCHGTESYLTKYSALSLEERADLKKLEDWVAGFVPGPCVYRGEDEQGKRVLLPVLGEDGKQEYAPRLIETYKLLSCKSGAARKILLGNKLVFRCFAFLSVSLYFDLLCVLILPVVPSADNMDSQASDILRMLSKPKKKGAKKGASSAVSSGMVSPASPAIGAISSKRQRTVSPEEDLVVLDIDPKGKTPIPPCWSQPGLFEKRPLHVESREKAAILGMDPKRREDSLAQDVAGVMRLLSTVLVLNESAGTPNKELEAARVKLQELEVVNTGLENTVSDLQEKTRVFANLQAELNEKTREVEELKKVEEVKRGVEEELQKLKEEMAPAHNEPVYTKSLKTRAALVKECSEVYGQLTRLAKRSYRNAVAQLSIVNPGISLDGTDFWREVKKGKIVLSEAGKANELMDLGLEEEEEDDEDDDVEETGEGVMDQDPPVIVEQVDDTPEREDEN
jgi:hypothetical protein